jgi:hypothetical protein
MRRAHQDLLLSGVVVFIDIAASALLVRRLQARGYASLRRYDDLEIFARHNKSVLAAAIHPLKQFDDLSLQGGLSRRIQCRKMRGWSGRNMS